MSQNVTNRGKNKRRRNILGNYSGDYFSDNHGLRIF